MTSKSDVPETAAESAKTNRRWVGRILKVFGGLLMGLVLTEAIFHWRDQGAFPHLNVYQANAELGVQLEPRAEQKISFGGNPVTSVRIGDAGLRAPATGAPPDQVAVVVLGDSQVFGLGVEYEDTFSAKLGEKLKKPVLNAGIPTYGPREYNAVLGRLLDEQKVEHVVYVVNIANDLFEAARPNKERHVSWDGWAVRIETAPEDVTEFPGRRWLYGRSHAFFALRKWLYRQEVDLDDAAFPSEGGWQDLIKEGDSADEQRAMRRQEFIRLAQFRDAEARAAERKLMQAQLAVERVMYDEVIGDNWTLSARLRTARAKPGDIVTAAPGEGGRPLAATAEQIQYAVRYRNKMEEQLRQIAAEAQGDKKKKLTDVISRRDALAKEAEVLRTAPLSLVRANTPVANAVEEAHELCRKHDAQLWVVALPLDVQVSAEEWKKYPGKTVEMAGSEVLLSDIVGHAEGIGARGVDVMTALREAEPGAFLDHDLHLSVSGHEAVATAIASAMQAAHKPRVARSLPAGRSRIPRPEHWQLRKETLVKGSDAAGCETKLHREWLRVRCTQRVDTDPAPAGVRIVKGGADALAIHHDKVSTLIAPVVEGSEVRADFFWADGSRRQLIAEWKAGEVFAETFKFEGRPDAPAPAPAKEAERLCSCFKQLSKAASCSPLLAAPNAHCDATYRDDCVALIGCSQGDPVYPPDCPEGQVSAGGSGRCMACTDALCGPEVPVTSVSLAPAHDEEKLLSLSRSFLKAAEAFASRCEISAGWDDTFTDGCYLQGHCEPSRDDDKGCGYNKQHVKDVAAAFSSLEELSGANASRLRGPGADFVRNSALLAEHIARSTDFPESCLEHPSIWVRSSCFRDTRGIFALYQSMADAWNRWQPKDPIKTVPITKYYYGINERPLSGLQQTSRAVSLVAERYGGYYYGRERREVVENNQRLHWIRCHDGPCLLAGY